MMKSRLVVKYMMHCVAVLAAMLLLGVEAWGQGTLNGTSGCEGDVSTHITVRNTTAGTYYRVWNLDTNSAVSFAQTASGQRINVAQSATTGADMLFFGWGVYCEWS